MQEHTILNKRLEDIAWALFLIMIGVLWLMPAGRFPDGTWLIGTGVILLGLNLVRYARGIPMSAFSVILGILALAGGIGELYGVDLPLFALLLIVIGVGLIVRPMFERKG